MKKVLSAILTLAALGTVSCTDWLSVRPSDRIDEEGAFSNLAGFRQALNGIYVELNRDALYGRSLTSEFVEILAQRYAVSTEAKDNHLLLEYEYGGSNAMSRIQSIWQAGYNLIANTNLLIRNCEKQRGTTILTEDYYRLIKGEALALRGMLHFDMFRLFGPVYSGNEEYVSIPYYTEFSLNVAPSLKANDYMQHVIDDLLAAEEALKDDPIITYGPKGDELVPFLSYRNLRLNYYAVQALLARAYLYIGDTDNAYKYASAVIGVQEKWFPWINQLALQGDNPDRIFSTEVIFALQNVNRKNIFTSLFDGSNLKAETLLAPKSEVVDYIFDNEKQDYRYVTWFSSIVELGGVNYRIFNKYQSTKDETYNQMLPMIRVSEMYLIAAETAPTEKEGAEYFNTLRNHRGLAGRPTWQYAYYFDEEYTMEFYGEGQLFYYYKRNNKSSINSCDLYGSVSMSSSKYKLPIPYGESDFN